MHVAALGLSPLKGGSRHRPRSFRLTASGPEGDRRFALVDPVARRVLRTVENPSLLALRVEVTAGRRPGPQEPGPGPEERRDVLTVHVPGAGPVTAPVSGSSRVRADYWGREPELTVLDGPWAEALSAYLGRAVVVAEAAPRDVVYAGGVTVVTTSSLREVARRAGRPATDAALLEDAERWRANLVVGTGDAPPFTEDRWVGTRLLVGTTELAVRATVPRCAVVRLRPGHGTRERWDPLGLLVPDRLVEQEIRFGVDCEVVRAGSVAVGDPVRSA